MERRRKYTLAIALFCGAIAVIIAAEFWVRSIAVSRFDFPNENNLLKRRLDEKKIIEDVADIIAFKPSIVCVSVSGVDARQIYIKSTQNELKLNLAKASYYEGYSIFLFANQDKYYIEKFVKVDVSFDNLQFNECMKIPNSASISLLSPSNQRRYSRFSGEMQLK